MQIVHILDRHPHVKKAVGVVDSTDHNLKGFYWREAVIKEMAKQYHPDGRITSAALDWAEMEMDEYDNDNGQ